MDLKIAQNIFAVRLYEWSQRDFYRELEEGCPLLSSMGLNNRNMAAFVDWNETLSSKERRTLVIALTHLYHENALHSKGEVATSEDKKWDNIFYEKVKFHREKIPPLETANRNNPGFRPVNPSKCLDYLAGFLSPLMGSVIRHNLKVIATRKINNDWKIITEFTFLRREESLSFEYQFIRSDGGSVKNPHPAQGPFPRTLLLFYGVWASSVQVPSQADSEPMARVMAKLAEHFVAQADPLFEGLGVND